MGRRRIKPRKCNKAFAHSTFQEALAQKHRLIRDGAVGDKLEVYVCETTHKGKFHVGHAPGSRKK